MSWIEWFDQFVFFLIGGVTFVAAAGVVFVPRIIHACLCLLVALIGIAGLYGLLAANLWKNHLESPSRAITIAPIRAISNTTETSSKESR